ncbi:MAG: hypothetical protein ACYTE8_09500, partial [Planctomycetota bacterium]
MSEIVQCPILLYPIFVPIVIGFLLLFLPKRFSILSKALALIISAAVLILSINIFTTASNSSQLKFIFTVLQIDNFNLELVLNARPLGS